MTGIFLIQDDEQLVEMTEQGFVTEDHLQALLAKYPNLLVGDQIAPNSPRRWLLVKREMGIPGAEGGSDRWSLDHLFLDQDGIPTLVEVKRSSDTRIRREVVGQMLDYAANAVVYWPVEQIRGEFDANCKSNGQDGGQIVQEFVGPDADVEEFWKKTKINLQAGRIRMLFVADIIPPELRRIVEFLNEQMDPAEVLAIEVRQYVGGNGMRTIVPRLFGQTAEAARNKGTSGPRKQWDEPTFLEQLRTAKGDRQVEVARKIIDWVRRNGGETRWGAGSSTASFSAVFEHHGVSYIPFALYAAWNNVVLNLGHLSRRPPFDSEALRNELVERLQRVPGLILKTKENPEFSKDLLLDEGNIATFLDAMTWAVMEIRRSTPATHEPEVAVQR